MIRKVVANFEGRVYDELPVPNPLQRSKTWGQVVQIVRIALFGLMLVATDQFIISAVHAGGPVVLAIHIAHLVAFAGLLLDDIEREWADRYQRLKDFLFR